MRAGAGARDQGLGAAGSCTHLSSTFHGVPQLALHLRAILVGEAHHRFVLGGQRAETLLLGVPPSLLHPGTNSFLHPWHQPHP